jgi:hypothetical protein
MRSNEFNKNPALLKIDLDDQPVIIMIDHKNRPVIPNGPGRIKVLRYISRLFPALGADVYTGSTIKTLKNILNRLAN